MQGSLGFRRSLTHMINVTYSDARQVNRRYVLPGRENTLTGSRPRSLAQLRRSKTHNLRLNYTRTFAPGDQVTEGISEAAA